MVHFVPSNPVHLLIGKNYNEDIINEDGQRITLEKTVGPTDNFNLFLAKFSEQKIKIKK